MATTTTTISRATLHTTNNPTPAQLDTFLDLLSTSYLQTPLTTSFITEIDSTPPPYPSQTITPSRLKSHFSLGITTVAKSDILLTFAYASQSTTSTEIPSSSPSSTKPLAAALIFPPTFTGTPPTHARQQPGPLLREYRTLSRHLQTKHLSIPDSGPRSYAQPSAPSQSSAGPSEDPFPGDFNKDPAAVEVRGSYQLAFLARDADADASEVDMAVRELVAEYQGIAGEEGVPIWLLAGSEPLVEEFEEVGFTVVDREVVGRGRVDALGWPSPSGDGPGVRVWALMWEAETAL